MQQRYYEQDLGRFLSVDLVVADSVLALIRPGLRRHTGPDVHSTLSGAPIWSPTPYLEEIGREEAFFSKNRSSASLTEPKPAWQSRTCACAIA
ncbi:hypothetical protein GGR62_000752 [Xanthomonas campestris]|nr:hypothetical protein [Xanthomonas sp. 3075]